MASVCKREGSKYYYGTFKAADGKYRTRSCRTTDKRVAQRIAQRWEIEAADIREGRVDPRAQRYRDHEAQALKRHITDFEAMLKAKGNTAGHVKETVAHVRRIAGMIKAKQLSDLTPDAVRQAIAKIRTSGRSLRTCNAILRSVKTFAGWLEADGRTRRNDLKHLSGYNADTDRRRVRRDLEPQEMRRLIAAAECGPVMMRMSGPDRAMAYRLAAGTGFRASELASLRLASFNLDADPPTVKVQAAYTKRRRDDEQPIRRELADLLRPWLANRPTDARLLDLPEKKAAQLLRADLRRARAWWIREASARAERRERRKSPFLRVADDAGRVADFHALRHTYVSRVVASGASVKVAQELARHSTPALTIGRYAHVRLHDLTPALAALDGPPALVVDERSLRLAATGTDDLTAHGRGAVNAQNKKREMARQNAGQRSGDGNPEAGSDRRKSLSDAAQNKTPRVSAGSCKSEGDGARTRNLRI
ncbi:MAG: tyrosine-type recombinase/integrase, partial [Pirellulales bacterium]